MPYMSRDASPDASLFYENLDAARDVSLDTPFLHILAQISELPLFYEKLSVRPKMHLWTIFLTKS